MNRTRSSLVRRKLALESLEERWTPATGSTSLAWLSGLRAGVAANVSTGTGTLGAGAVTPVVTTPSTPLRTFNNAILRSGVNSAQVRPGLLTGAASTPRVANVSLMGMSSMSVASRTPTTPTQANTTVTTSANKVVPTVPANVSGDLASAYLHSVDATQAVSPSLDIVGSNVRVSIAGTANGDFNAMVTSLRNLGMQIQSADATYHAVRGLLPISQIPTAAAIPQVLSMSALRKPIRM